MLKVTTTAPVYVGKKKVSGTNPPTFAGNKKAEKKHSYADEEPTSGAHGKLLNKIKGGIQKVKNSGVLNNLGIGGMNTGMQGNVNSMPQQTVVPPVVNDHDGVHGSIHDVKAGLSTGAKVGIAVGVAAVVGIIIYVVRKKKK